MYVCIYIYTYVYGLYLCVYIYIYISVDCAVQQLQVIRSHCSESSEPCAPQNVLVLHLDTHVSHGQDSSLCKTNGSLKVSGCYMCIVCELPLFPELSTSSGPTDIWRSTLQYMGTCQNDGPLCGPLNYIKDPKRDHNFDSHPCGPAWPLYTSTSRIGCSPRTPLLGPGLVISRLVSTLPAAVAIPLTTKAILLVGYL